MMIKQNIRCFAAASTSISTLSGTQSRLIRSRYTTRIWKGCEYRAIRSESFSIEIDKKDSVATLKGIQKERVISVDRSGLREGSVRRISNDELMNIGVGKGT